MWLSCDTFISKAHTNFTSILIEAQSQDEFVRRVKALPRHAVDDDSQCDYHPLVVCSCGACENKDQISCQGKPYKTKDCKFHALLYEIECHARAKQVKELIHPVLKRGHSHNVFIRFRSKDIYLGRLHYLASGYMHAKFGISYHWIPELYRRMKLPVFDGVQEALEKHNLQCKRKLEREKTTPVEKRIELKKRKDFSVQSGNGRDAYGGNDEHESDHEKVVKRKRGKAKPRKAKPKSEGLCSACGSSTHKRSTHRDCPFNTKRSTAKISTKSVIVAVDSPSQSSDAVSDVHSISDAVSETGGIDSDDYMMYDLCTCGSSGRAHKRDCLMNFRRRHLPQPPGESAHSPPLSTS